MSNYMQQDEPRRYLIAIGSPHCSNLGLSSLPEVKSDIEKIVKLFTHSQQGYTRVDSPQFPLGAPSSEIRDALGKWFSHPERRASDCVIIYYAGHGDEGGRFSDHYLFTVESREGSLPTTAIETRSLVKSLFQGNNDYPQNVLLILDVCYAEIGQRQALNALSNLQNVGSMGGGVWLIASSIDTRAGDGAFVAALEKVMQIEHEKAIEFLTISTLMGLLNQHFKDTKQAQRAKANATDVMGETLFIRNPCFLRSQPETGCTLEAKEASQVSAQPRIDPIAEAVAKLSTDYEELNETFFDRYRQNSGKSNLLKTKLATWSMILQGNYVERDQQNAALDTVLRLAALDCTSLLIIRGEPGAGKTALMRWLAYQLVQQGERVFEKKTQGFDWLEQLRLFSEETSGEHFYVLVDDLFRDEAILEELEENELLFPFTLIGTTRRNEDQHDALDEHYEIRWLDLERPSNTEKERLLDLPLVRDSLRAMSAQKKQELMAAPTMLVLMLQLSEGKTFEKVIADIIQRLPNTEECPIYEAFGIICSFFQHGIAVYPEILTLCLSNRKCSLPVIQAELEGLIEIAPFAGFEGFTTIHELIAKTAMTLPYERGRSSGNLPYSISNPTLLDRYLAVAIHCLDPTQKTHRRWAYSGLRKLAISGETRLVHQLLQDYQGEIQKLQQMGGFGDWSNWASFYRLLGLEQERLRCLNSMLQAEPQTSNEVGYCIMPLAKHVTGEQKHDLIKKVEKWLSDYPNAHHIREQYLLLVNAYCDAKQKQVAIAQTEQWLIDHPDDFLVRMRYLAIMESFVDVKQKQVAIAQTEQWLIDHPDNTDVRTKYLAIVLRFGSVKQRQSAITQTEQWLDNNIQQLKTSHKHITYETNVRKRRRHKSHRAEQSAINGTDVQMVYLALVQDHGTVEQKQGAAARAVQWLYNHSSSPYYSQVETEYLYWIGRNKSSENIQPIIKQLQVIIEQVLKKCRDEATLLIIFGNFRDYLDYETCHSISTKIIQFSLSIEKWQNLIHAANFFRDHAEIEKAEEIYRKILRSAKLNNGRSSADVQKTIDFASLSYAQLLLLKDPQESEAALKLLRPILAKNFKHAVAHWLTARCYQSMDDSNRAIDSFKKAIRFDQHQKGTFYYQFGCFYLDTLSDEVNARECFENSLNQQINLPACIALAELEIKSQNYDRAQSLLNQALALEPTNRPEQEERDRFSQRIQTLQARLKELSG